LYFSSSMRLFTEFIEEFIDTLSHTTPQKTDTIIASVLTFSVLNIMFKAFSIAISTLNIVKRGQKRGKKNCNCNLATISCKMRVIYFLIPQNMQYIPFFSSIFGFLRGEFLIYWQRQTLVQNRATTGSCPYIRRF